MFSSPLQDHFLSLRLLLVLFATTVLTSSHGEAASCPDLREIRSESVKGGSFDVKRTKGSWYEIAFQDIAQIGASCQHFNNSYDQNRGEVVRTSVIISDIATS